ncbi:UNVERIFIED_CONTAM: hypothetical protein PYX00_001778 [Menopon gallinae]|uniref:Uncharacterized protein n=1 Tax=Menopon gallinae TaxID=328185 RepID=A0AAW2IE50_9NEOP
MGALNTLGMRFTFVFLIGYVSALPQYYDRMQPTYYESEPNYMYLVTDSPPTIMEPDYWTNIHQDEVAPVYEQKNSKIPEVLTSLQPIYEPSQFNPEFSHENAAYNFGQIMERGRSDIDPIEDNNGLGYFYPKPSIPFELPHFVPLSGPQEKEEPAEDVTIIAATVRNGEDITEKTTTTSTTPQTNASSQDVSNKVELTTN